MGINAEDLIKLTEHFNNVKTWNHYHYDFTDIHDLLNNNERMTAWCKKHLKGKWSNYFSLWSFEEVNDYLLFLLRCP